MIKKIGIENFRIFKELTEFELAPITVLTGTNNSGKSSFLKMINLLQQTAKDLGSLNILNFVSGNHNLGIFENAISWDSDKENLTIIFDFPLDYFDEDFKLELIYRKMGEIGFIKSFKIFNSNRDLCVIDDIELDDSNYQTFTNNESAYFYYFTFDLGYIKKFIFQEKTKNITISNDSIDKEVDFLFYTYKKRDGDRRINLNESIKNEPEKYKNLRDDLLLVESHVNLTRESCNSFFFKNKNSDLFTDSFDEIDEPLFIWKYEDSLDMSDKFKSNLLKYREGYDVFNEKISIDIEPENLTLFRELVINNIQNNLDALKSSLKNIDFISVQRGDSNGEISEVAKLYSNAHLNTNHSFIIKSLELLDIKGELIIERNQGRFTTVFLLRNGKKTDVADLGYGYSQIIPILLKIVLSAELNMVNRASFSRDSTDDSLKSIIVIEEPDANLHPNLQSKLADVFVLAYKELDTHFILETHSEYLIRKLQYLTAKKEITPEETVIYYFNADEYVTKKEPKVKEIKITEFGALTDSFGPGFFDEATNLKFELMKLNQAQNN